MNRCLVALIQADSQQKINLSAPKKRKSCWEILQFLCLVQSQARSFCNKVSLISSSPEHPSSLFCWLLWVVLPPYFLIEHRMQEGGRTVRKKFNWCFWYTAWSCHFNRLHGRKKLGSLSASDHLIFRRNFSSWRYHLTFSTAKRPMKPLLHGEVLRFASQWQCKAISKAVCWHSWSPSNLAALQSSEILFSFLRCINSNSPNLDSLHIWDWVLMNAKLSSFHLRMAEDTGTQHSSPSNPNCISNLQIQEDKSNFSVKTSWKNQPQTLSGNLKDSHVSNLSIKPDRKL